VLGIAALEPSACTESAAAALGVLLSCVVVMPIYLKALWLAAFEEGGSSIQHPAS
jgi:hypothetical protein